MRVTNELFKAKLWRLADMLRHDAVELEAVPHANQSPFVLGCNETALASSFPVNK